MTTFKVWARWRPLKSAESHNGEITRTSDGDHTRQRHGISISIAASARDKVFSSRERSWKSGLSFDGVIEPDEKNNVAYNRLVAPIISGVLQGKCCNFFADRRVHIRGETEILEDGKVRVRPITTRAFWSFEEVQRQLREALKQRETATSTIHDQSSRTHAIIEMEIITSDLLRARDSVVERQSELVPVGKYATDVYIEEQLLAVVQTEDGKYVPNPDYDMTRQQRVHDAEIKKAEFETRVKEAEEYESEVFASIAQLHQCIGGRLVFVDLAGAEFLSGPTTSGSMLKQTPQEKQQGRQINTDLLALKEVIRARSNTSQSRIPYRSSPLTMVLRHHFEASADSQSSIVVTVSPEADQYAATMNTLKYADLIGLANTRGG